MITTVCKTCYLLAQWIECPTGGWWAHLTQAKDRHDVDADWQPVEEIDERGDWVTAR